VGYPLNANDPFDVVANPIPYGSGDDVYSVSPNDSTDLPTAARGIRCAGAGVVIVNTRGGSSINAPASGNPRTMNFAAGETRYVRIIRVLSTNTTATGIEAIV
jgi:hypothetical protein